MRKCLTQYAPQIAAARRHDIKFNLAFTKKVDVLSLVQICRMRHVLHAFNHGYDGVCRGTRVRP